jgi:tetratricopeptide (TPR) repeat protein
MESTVIERASPGAAALIMAVGLMFAAVAPLTAAPHSAAGARALPGVRTPAGAPKTASALGMKGDAPRNLPLLMEYAEAEQAFKGGDLSLALQRYMKIIETHGDQPLAWFRIATIHQQRQSLAAALHAYDAALSSAKAVGPPGTLPAALARIRYNRALLLIDSAARDLHDIPATALTHDLELSREAVSEHLDDALLLVAGRAPVDPTAAESHDRAAGYVQTYERSAAVSRSGHPEGSNRDHAHTQ